MFSQEQHGNRWGYIGSLATVAAVFFLASLYSSQARAASDDVCQTSYYDVATHVAASASGYGGPGTSGGSGDSLLRIVNPTSGDTTANGTLCAMIYVFDDIEEMQACCGCPVTPDGLLTLSVINEVTSNFGVSHGNVIAGTIDVLSSAPNFTAAPGSPIPPGVNLVGPNGPSNLYCDPGANQGPLPLRPALRSYMNHTETMGPVGGSSFITANSIDEFASCGFDSRHISNLESDCLKLQTNFSGAGACLCAPPPPSPTPTPTPTPSPSPSPTPTPSPTPSPSPTPTPTPSPTPSPTPTPTPIPVNLLGCNVGSTLDTGGPSITLGTSFVVHTNNLLLAAVQTQSIPPATPPTITAPVGWTLISDDTSGASTDFRQDYFFHVVTAGENGTSPSYAFTFSNANTIGEGGIIGYNDTCLDNSGSFTQCASPIHSQQSHSTNASTTVATGTGAFTFPAFGKDIAAFGSFETASNISTPSGGMASHCADATNSAIFFADKNEGSPAGTDGPFTATSSAAGDNVGQAVSVCAKNTTTCP